MKNVFIGIDFSKSKFDAAIYQPSIHSNFSNKVFDNEHSGFDSFLNWVSSETNCEPCNLLFCGEHTGFYSAKLSAFLYESGYDMWLVSGLQVKLTQGIKRAKTDRVDSTKIAEYVFRHQDKAVFYKPISETLDQIRDLLSHRERLVELRKILTTASNELKRIKNHCASNLIYIDSLNHIKSLSASIKHCESQIEELLKQDTTLLTNYKLLISVIGIGLVNATLILVATSNFTTITNPRKFGCYCGVVPFEYRSGTSIHGRTRVSKLANKNLKTKLTLAAYNSIHHDPEMKAYFLRKTNEGKNHWLVLNNVKNKLIHRVFAVVRTGTIYDKNYTYPQLNSTKSNPSLSTDSQTQ